MVWDPEKYREKREKVLGIKKQGITFSSLATMVSLAILLGFAFVYVPGAISYIQTRHLDDAIYRLAGNNVWPGTLVKEIQQLSGVRKASQDTQGTRLVVTFDRRLSGPDIFIALFRQKNLDAALLNQVNHHQRQATLEKESERETL
jgi:hypothetical protein